MSVNRENENLDSTNIKAKLKRCTECGEYIAKDGPEECEDCIAKTFKEFIPDKN